MARFKKVTVVHFRRRRRGHGKHTRQRRPVRREGAVEPEVLEPDEIEPPDEASWFEEEIGRRLPVVGDLDGWGPLTSMSANVQMRARRGYRAAVVELKPGLLLVAEVPQVAAEPELGFLPLLMPGILNAATKTITAVSQGVKQGVDARKAGESGGDAAKKGLATAWESLTAPKAATPAAPTTEGIGCDDCGCCDCRRKRKHRSAGRRGRR